jgi:CelD/BcsL family acetyltransferase involved in cellulose biosynthesis
MTRAEIHSDIAGLEDKWWDLWKRDSAASAFQSPAWLVPWRAHFSEGESRILTITRGQKLVALLPLFRYDGRLLPWGTGTTDWLDGIFDPDLELAELTGALGLLTDAIDLVQLPATSPLLKAPLPDGWAERRGRSETCVALPLPARLPRNLSENLRYYRRRAARAGVSEPERASPIVFDEIVELHTRRWRERGQPGVLSDLRVLAWHRDALPALEAAGLLRLYVLRLRERIVGGLYVLCSKHKAFYYIGGFDPELEQLGLGTILIGHAISEAEREGAHVFDFLRGQEAYKYRWGAADQLSQARLLCPPER